MEKNKINEVIHEKIDHIEEVIEEKIEHQIDESMNHSFSKRYFKWGILLLLIAGVVYAYFLTPLKSYLTQEFISNFINQFGIFAPFVFIIIYIIALLFFIPSIIVTLLGGILFGLLYGTIYVVIAATISAAIGFTITRKLSDKFGSKSGSHRFNNKLVQKLVDQCNHHCERNGIQAFFILRFLGLPYMPLSYAAGLVKSARLKDFIIATFFSNIVGSFTFVYLGSQLQNGLKALIIPIALIGLTLLIPRIVKKFQKDSKKRINKI